MEILNGPIRLVLLHSGKYDYAEVEIDVPLHLVGPNNVGKTSLIAALQFLYIDCTEGDAFLKIHGGNTPLLSSRSQQLHPLRTPGTYRLPDAWRSRPWTT